MEVFWFLVVGLMMLVYILLDGFDFGAGIIHLFYAKTDQQRKEVMRAIGPFWDGNEVWIIAGGGLLFSFFPMLYASAFSGFYLPLIMILWFYIFRALGIEFTGLIKHELWQKPWRFGFGISSLLLALFFGIAFGNVIRGVNLGRVIDGVKTYKQDYSFFTPLWDSSFSPYSEHPGILDWFTLSFGIVAVLVLLIHAIYWMVLKIDSDFTIALKKKVPALASLLVIFIGITAFTVLKFPHVKTSNFLEYPFLLPLPFLLIFGIIGIFIAVKSKKDWLGFLCSSLTITGGVGTLLAMLYPTIIPSNNNMVESLTIFNTATNGYAMEVGLVWWPISFLLVIAYTYNLHRIYRGKLTEKHDHH